MYFVNEYHKDNYFVLMGMYGFIPGEDSQYEASIYIAAYPEIFKAYDIDLLRKQIKKSHMGPIYYIYDNEYNAGHSPGALTGTTRALCEVGLSLFNGYRIGLDDVFGSIGSSREALKVFFEACDIRTKGKLKGVIK